MNHVLHVWLISYPLSWALGTLLISIVASIYAAEIKGLINFPIAIVAPWIVRYRIRALVSRIWLLADLRENTHKLLLSCLPPLLLALSCGIGMGLIIVLEVNYPLVLRTQHHFGLSVVIPVMCTLITGRAVVDLIWATWIVIQLGNYDHVIARLTKHVVRWLNKTKMTHLERTEFLLCLANPDLRFKKCAEATLDDQTSNG